MEVIWPDNITAITADEEETNYDVENVSNNEPGHLWKATSADAQIKLTVAAYSSALGLLGASAGTVTVTVKDETETSTLVAAAEFDISGVGNFTDYYLGAGGIYDAFFYDYGVINEIHTVIIDFDADTSPAYCGIIRCGLGWEFPNPETGFSEQRRSHSVEIPYTTGGMPYVRTISSQRILTGRWLLDRETESQNLLNRLARDMDLQPAVWNLLDINNHDWVVFGKMSPNNMMSLTHEVNNATYMNLTIEEIA